MKKEELLALGITEENANKILDLHKSEISGNFIPKSRFDEINNELKGVKTQLTERDTQIETLSKFKGNADEIKAKFEELQAKNKESEKKYQAELGLEKKKNAIQLAILSDELKAHDSALVASFFQTDLINVDESGKLTGFKEQLETIKKEKPFLFVPNENKKEATKQPPAGWNVKGTTPPEGTDKGNTPPDNGKSYGLGLANTKLGMMGINPNANQQQTK